MADEMSLMREMIAYKRADQRMGVRKAAAQIGTSPAALSRLENTGTPDIQTFLSICRWLGVSPNYLLGWKFTKENI